MDLDPDTALTESCTVACDFLDAESGEAQGAGR